MKLLPPTLYLEAEDFSGEMLKKKETVLLRD
ncbi:hypothetical protein GGQ95_002854 [Anoxybacillus rupiensis]|nr:hypothetical protein [Anoxybacillus rupiensis]